MNFLLSLLLIYTLILLLFYLGSTVLSVLHVLCVLSYPLYLCSAAV